MGEERWTIYRCPDCGEQVAWDGTSHGIQDWGCPHTMIDPVPVEVVPAARLAEVEAALRGIDVHYCRPKGESWEDAYNEVAAIARETLGRLNSARPNSDGQRSDLPPGALSRPQTEDEV